MVVAFSGHRDTPPDIQSRLETLLIHLIEHHGATHFYIGNHGSFDHLAQYTLEKLSLHYVFVRFIPHTSGCRPHRAVHPVPPSAYTAAECGTGL